MVQIQLFFATTAVVPEPSLNPTWFRYNTFSILFPLALAMFKSHMVQIQHTDLSMKLFNRISLNPTWFRYNSISLFSYLNHVGV